jgi:hypothetical protein
VGAIKRALDMQNTERAQASRERGAAQIPNNSTK